MNAWRLGADRARFSLSRWHLFVCFVRTVILLLCCVSAASGLAADKENSIDRVPFSLAGPLGQPNGSRGDADLNAVPTYSVGISTTSYLAGSVALEFAATGSGPTVNTTLVFPAAPVLDGSTVFNSEGDYIFSRPLQFNSVNLEAGEYSVSLTASLIGAEAGLTGECEIDGMQTVSVSAEGVVSPVQLEVYCGTPTKRLATELLDEVRAAAAGGNTSFLPPVVFDAELFAVCLGNGGSNRIYGLDSSALGDTDDLGNGVRFVEELFELQSLIDSEGAGIQLTCNGLSDGAFGSSVIDESLWRYLVRLDLFRQIDLDGAEFEGDSAPGAGTYGDEEILSILAPYEALIASAASPFEPLTNSPTKRLRRLNFNFNTFSSTRWFDLSRISSNNAYSVGDRATSNNAESFYGYGVDIKVSQGALDLFNTFQSDPELEIEVSGTSARASGGNDLVRIALDGNKVFISEVITLSDGGLEDPLDLTVFGIPPGVSCVADVSPDPLEDGVRVPFDGFEYRVNGGQPLNLSCVAQATFPVPITTTSYLGGSIEVDFNSTDNSGGFFIATLDFPDPELTGENLFDEFGSYVFTPPLQNDSASLLPGTYSVSVFPDLTGAEAGLSGECDLVGATEITVSPGGELSSSAIEIVCGTPTKKLSDSVLIAAQEAGRRNDLVLPGVVDGPELFAVCLGNGGSNVIYDSDPTDFVSDPEAFRQLGTGVRFVEDLLSLPSLAASQGEGIDVYCSAMAADSVEGSVIDEPMWRYLVRLDVFRRVFVGGLETFNTFGAGSYGSEEILSLLSPYEELFNAAPLPYGVLEDTVTRRLRFLEFSYNSFATPRWSDLWRISANPAYSVGDVRTANDFGIVYSFGVQIDVTPEAQSRLGEQSFPPLVKIEPDEVFGNPSEGLSSILEFPVVDETGLIFGPINLGDFPEDLMLLSVEGLPSGVICVAGGVGELNNGVRVSIDGYQYRPYAETTALTISCGLSSQMNRVRATFAFPDPVTGFSEFDGEVTGRLIDASSLNVVVELQAELVGERREYLFVADPVADGSYRLEVDVSDATSSRVFGCELGGDVFAVDGDDVELGKLSCSETTSVSSIGSGIIANCLRTNGFQFLHQLQSDLTELSCEASSGTFDFELLAKPTVITTLNLRNSSISTSQLQNLAAFDVNAVTFQKLNLDGVSGLSGIANSEFYGLSKRFSQIGTGALEFPAGNGIVAQCMRRIGFASFDDQQLFSNGANLDCSGLTGFDDIASMSDYLRDPVFRESEFDFSESGLEVSSLSNLADTFNSFFGGSVLRLGGNSGLSGLGLVDYSRMARAFSVVDLGSFAFPNLTYIKASDPQADAGFGSSVALSADGNVLVVGAPGWSSSEHAQVGKLYIFTRSAEGVWVEQSARVLGGLSARDGARYGENVAVSDDGARIAVAYYNGGGGRTVDLLGLSEFGYVFEDSVSSASSLGDSLLFHTEQSETYLFLGEPAALITNGIAAGRVYAYRREPSSPFDLWQLFRQYEPPASAASAGDRFGAAIAVQGAETSFTFDDAILIGVPGDDSLNPSTTITRYGSPLSNDDETDSGAVYVYPELASTSSSFTYLKDEPGPVGFEPKEFGRNMSFSLTDRMILSRNEAMRFGSGLSSFTSTGSEFAVSDVSRYDRSIENLRLKSSIALLSTRGTRQLELARPAAIGAPLVPLLSLTRVLSESRAAADFGIEIDLSADGDRAVFAAPGEDGGQAGVGATEGDSLAVDSGAVYVSP